jgi:hypothetical protein
MNILSKNDDLSQKFNFEHHPGSRDNKKFCFKVLFAFDMLWTFYEYQLNNLFEILLSFDRVDVNI